MSSRRSRRISGSTLIELVVSSALVVLLMGEVWYLTSAGSRFYLKIKGKTEMQKSALIALRWFSKDLAEGAPLSFRHYDPELGMETSYDGLVFGSPKDVNDQVYYNGSGQLLWTSIIGYYIDPTNNNLYRTKLPLPDSDYPTRAPLIDDSLYHIDRMATISERRAIAHHVVDLTSEQSTQSVKIVVHCRDEDLGFGLKVQTRLEMKNR